MTAYDIRIMNLTLKRLENSHVSILSIDHSVDHEHHITVESDQKQKWPVMVRNWPIFAPKWPMIELKRLMMYPR